MKKIFSYVFLLFIIWRVYISAIIYFGRNLFTLQSSYLGGGHGLYIQNPFLWSWANFDGEHYLSIARYGYRPLQYFFFPIYPMLIQKIALIFGDTIQIYLISGLAISHISLILALVGLYKLIMLDYSESIARRTIFFILIFPTSFYFGSLYTESIFLMFVVWSFYFARSNNWIVSSIFGMFASATRLAGLVLFFSLFSDLILKKTSKISLVQKISIILIPIGLFSYMYYLNNTTGDPLAFFHNVEIFGQQRSSHLILLPQVFYRYIFKILPSLTPYFPVVFTTIMEFIIGLLLLFSVFAGFSIKKSYLVYLLGSYILPTLSGSFSSLPRYTLTIFPFFLLMSIMSHKVPRVLLIVFIGVLLMSLSIATLLFSRGYWVS